MADILLIHGAAHGGWCFARLAAALADLGHVGRAIDLPGRSDGRDPADVTLDDHADAVEAALGERTVVVGHSLGGLAATAGADRAPERVAALVYLCAWVPEAGRPVSDFRDRGMTKALAEAQSVRDGAIVYDPALAREPFYHDCEAEDAEAALARLTPEPLTPVKTLYAPRNPVHPSRHYIVCEDDRAIRPDWQTGASAGWPEGHVHRLTAGHSPFLSCPDRLARILDTIAKASE